MKTFAILFISLAGLASCSTVFAQGKTRAEVVQELIEAQQNGLSYVTDTSYPEVNPLYAGRVARMQAKAARAMQQDDVASVGGTAHPAN